MKNLNNDTYRSLWEQWAMQMASEFKAQVCPDTNLSVTEFLRGHAFFGSMTFNRNLMEIIKKEAGRPFTDTSFEFDQFHRFYNETFRALQRIRGRGAPSTPPFAIIGLDFNGTRDPGKDAEDPENFHLHWLIIVGPEDVENARKLFASLKVRYHFRTKTMVDGIQCEPFDPTRKAFGSLAGYCLKGDVVAQGQWGHDTIRRYPSDEYRLQRSYTSNTPADRSRMRGRRKMRGLQGKYCRPFPWEVDRGSTNGMGAGSPDAQFNISR